MKAFIGGLVLASAAPAAERLTLSEAVDIALANNPRIQAVAAEAAAAAARSSEARAGFLPTVGFSETWQRSDNPVFVFGSLLEQGRFRAENLDLGALNDPAPLDNFRTAIELRLPLFDRLKSPTAVSRSRIAVEQANEARRLVEQQIRFEVLRAYYGVAVSRAQQEVANEAVTSAEAEAVRVRDRFRHKMVTEADLGAAEVDLADLRQAQIRAVGDVATAGAALATSLGRSVVNPAESVGELPSQIPELPSEQQLLEMALERRPDYRQASSAVESSEKEIVAALGEYLPRLDLQASYGRSAENLVNGSADYAVGARLSLDVFDAAREARVRQAKAARDAANAARRRKADEIHLEVVRAYHSTLSARERAAVAAQAGAQARETLRIVEDRYQVGLTTVTEVLRARTALVRARTNLVVAQYDHAVGYAQALLASGSLDDLSPFGS